MIEDYYQKSTKGFEEHKINDLLVIKIALKNKPYL